MRIFRLYLWSGLTQCNQILSGTIISRTENEAIHQLISQNITPVSLLCHRRLVYSYKEKQYLPHFTQQLATLLVSGLPLLRALILLHNECRLPLWKQVIDDLTRQLQQGKTFTRGISLYPDLFNSFFCQMITVGEETGKLPECLHCISKHIHDQQHHRTSLIKAIRYPVTLLIVSSLMIILMFIFVIPEFSQIYQSFNAELPLLTQQLIFFSEAITDHLLLTLGLIVIILSIYQVLRKKFAYIKEKESRCFLSVPFFGNIIIYTQTAQIFQMLAITQRAGITLIAGIDTLIMTTGHPLYKQALITIRAELLRGKALSKSIKQSGLFPELCREFIATGEATGKFDHFFTYTSDWFKSLALNQIQHFFKILQPVLFALLALIVALLLIAMYLPLFRLGEVLV